MPRVMPMIEDEMNELWEDFSPEERLVWEQEAAERRRDWAEYLADTMR